MRLHRVRHQFLTSFLGLFFFFGIGSLPVRGDLVKEATPLINPEPNSSNGQAGQPTDNSMKEANASAVQQGQDTDPAASASDPESEEDSIDPLEPLNRLVFAVNDLVDFVIIRPMAEIYRAVLPEPVRNGVTNVLDNLFAPLVFINHVLQGNPEEATVTVFRFLTNSTIGLFGLLDAASELGYPRYDTNFNETLTVWGMETGPYLYLPLVGPSSFRGTIGLAGDYYADPLNIYLNNRHHRKHRYWLTIRYGATILSQREKLIETLDNLNSLDKYVTLRSVYFQRQAYLAEKLKAAKTEQENKTGDDQG